MKKYKNRKWYPYLRRYVIFFMNVKLCLKLKLASVFCIFPIKKTKVVFDNFGGKGYGDNPKYIAEEMQRRKTEWDLVWLVKDMEEPVPKGIRKVKYGTWKALYEMATAQIWIDNIRNSIRPPKRKKQIYLQTWHGTCIAKLIEKDAESTLDPNYIKAAKKDGKTLDAVLANCILQEKLYKRAFWLRSEKQILRMGTPRNDYLYKNNGNERLKETIRKNLGISKDMGVVLYAPTFRDDSSMEGYQLDFEVVRQTFESRFKKKFCMVIRLHPNVQNQSELLSFNKDIINGSKIADCMELLLISDFLITDYSSTAFDFMLLKKPVFLVTLDIEKYKKTRGLMAEFEEYPFLRAKTQAEFIESIQKFDEEKYGQVMEELSIYFEPWEDGKASVKIVEWLIQKQKEL